MMGLLLVGIIEVSGEYFFVDGVGLKSIEVRVSVVFSVLDW